jgi:hypothetical protein
MAKADAAAVGTFDKALEQWLDNAEIKMLLGEAALKLNAQELKKKIKGVGKVTAAAVLGVVGIVILIVAAGGAIALKNSVGVLLR